MGKTLNIISPLHKKSQRNYIDRMINNKTDCMKIAKEYGHDYWDGDRCYGYGGYIYDGRWAAVAEKLIEQYSLKEDARILDIGCGKGFLMHELKKLLPHAEVCGLDISEYAIENALDFEKNKFFNLAAQEKYPFPDKYFDLVFSNTTLHDLNLIEVNNAVKEIERVGQNKFICVESYRTDIELFNLQCWALTCDSFFSPEEWKWIYEQAGYKGDYEFIYFE